MKFVFTDKSEDDKELLTDLLHSEHIKYAVKREAIELPCDCGDEDCDYFELLPIFHVEAYTTLEKFEFIKALFKKKKAENIWLEKCLRKKSYTDAQHKLLKPKRKKTVVR